MCIRDSVLPRGQDYLVGRGLLECRERDAEVERGASADHRLVELAEDAGLRGVAELSGPRDLLDERVDGAAERRRDVVELHVRPSGGATEDQARILPRGVQRRHALQGVAHPWRRRGDLDGVPGHVAVRVEEPPLAVAAVRLDSRVAVSYTHLRA